MTYEEPRIAQPIAIFGIDENGMLCLADLWNLNHSGLIPLDPYDVVVSAIAVVVGIDPVELGKRMTKISQENTP